MRPVESFAEQRDVRAIHAQAAVHHAWTALAEFDPIEPDVAALDAYCKFLGTYGQCERLPGRLPLPRSLHSAHFSPVRLEGKRPAVGLLQKCDFRRPLSVLDGEGGNSALAALKAGAAQAVQAILDLRIA